MKSVGAAFVAGLIGILVGSLSAQPAPEFGPGPNDREVPIHEGPIEGLTYEGLQPGSASYVEARRGMTAQVFSGWVALPEEGTFIPADRVRLLRFRPDGAAGPDRPRRTGEFGNEPAQDRPARPAGTFRED